MARGRYPPQGREILLRLQEHRMHFPSAWMSSSLPSLPSIFHPGNIIVVGEFLFSRSFSRPGAVASSMIGTNLDPNTDEAHSPARHLLHNTLFTRAIDAEEKRESWGAQKNKGAPAPCMFRCGRETKEEKGTEEAGKGTAVKA